MKQNGGGRPKGRLLDLINQAFGSYEEFRNHFEAAGNNQFGSGWAWLVWSYPENRLQVLRTPNAENPLTDSDLKPLLTMVSCVRVIACTFWFSSVYLLK